VKTLLIVRHTQAAGTAAAPSDFERPLTDEGRVQAEAQGRFLQRSGMVPDVVACSAAHRAAETAALLAQGAGVTRDIAHERHLYNATGQELLEYVQSTPGEVGRLAVVAHMPGVGELLSLLTTRHMDLAHVYKAGTIAVVQSEEPRWDAFNYGSGTLSVLFPPLLTGE